MPTNLLRAKTRPPGRAPSNEGIGSRRLLLSAGRARLPIETLPTPTAARILAALPLYSTAETWGASLHFELPVDTGRERGARLNVSAGDIAYWSEEDRVIIGYGPTPISRDGQIRLPSPCNIWARALDDVSLLNAVRAGEKVTLALDNR